MQRRNYYFLSIKGKAVIRKKEKTYINAKEDLGLSHVLSMFNLGSLVCLLEDVVSI